MENFQENIAAGAISNLVFVVLFAVGAWIKSRLNKSDCHLNCGCLQCDSELAELNKLQDHLKTTQSTQRTMLADIRHQLHLLQNGQPVQQPGSPV